MELRIEIAGDIVERQELLNGTQSITLEGVSHDGVWTLSASVSWNRGLIDYAGEGDVSLARADGAELYATLVRSDATDDPEAAPDADRLIVLQYEVDGGAADFAGCSGTVRAEVLTGGDEFRGTWVLTLDS
jgi:hypothetical protein